MCLGLEACGQSTGPYLAAVHNWIRSALLGRCRRRHQLLGMCSQIAAGSCLPGRA